MSLKKSEKDELTFDIDEIEEFIIAHPDAKIYLGCDSKRIRHKKVRYATVIIIHYGAAESTDGFGHGAKIFGEITQERIVDEYASKPFLRMIREVELTIQMFRRLEYTLITRIEDVEIHVDVNPKENHGSNVAYGAAQGMIESQLGISPKFKPEAFCASYGADRFCNV